MVCILSAESCDCRTCNGGTPAPPGYFGGSHCCCICHTLHGQDKAKWIADKYNKEKKEIGCVICGSENLNVVTFGAELYLIECRDCETKRQ